MPKKKVKAKPNEKKDGKTDDRSSLSKAGASRISEVVADDLISEELRTQLGEYLTSQYELLERTLSNLSIGDLFNASLVCKSWHHAAASVLRKREKNYKFRWHLQGKAPCNAANCLRNNIKYKTEFLLGFQLPKGDTLVVKELLECKPSGNGVCVPGLLGETYVIDSMSLEVPGYSAGNAFEYFSNRNTALLFPKTDRYIMETHFIRDELKLCVCGAIKRCCLATEQYGELKGILVFAKKPDFRFVTILYNRVLQELRRQPVALAGGIFSNVRHFSDNIWYSKDGILTLCFYGDVDCYSDVLTDRRKASIEPFIKNMRQKLGSIDPAKYQRIAFVIRCLDRPRGKEENLMFQKYFPDTPAFTMESYGECGYRADSRQCSDDPKISKIDVSISYQYSTSYFFVTIKLPAAYAK